MKKLLLVSVFLLGGCSNDIDSSVNLGLTGDAYEFTLKDNTRCVVFDGFFTGGITCDWRTIK